MHRVLVHGAATMRQLPLPAGTFSEEPQESRQKHKEYRCGQASKVCCLHSKHHARSVQLSHQQRPGDSSDHPRRTEAAKKEAGEDQGLVHSADISADISAEYKC